MITDYIGYWPMDETSGSNVNDESANNNDGTATGTTIVDGKIGKARSFNGTSDYVQIPDSDSLDLVSNFTISVWFKPTVLSQTSRYVLSKLNAGATDNAYAIIWEYVNNQVEFYASNFTGTDPRTGSGMGVPDTNWHHVVYTYDGTTWTGYIDGDSVFSVSRTFSLDVQSGVLNLATFTGTTHFADCTIDELRIYSRGLSAADVAELYKWSPGSRLLRPNLLRPRIFAPGIAR